MHLHMETKYKPSHTHTYIHIHTYIHFYAYRDSTILNSKSNTSMYRIIHIRVHINTLIQGDTT